MKKRYERSTTITSASLDFLDESGIAISRFRHRFQRDRPKTEKIIDPIYKLPKHKYLFYNNYAKMAKT